MSDQHSDGRVNRRMNNYTKFWEEDLSKEDDGNNQNRLGKYAEVVNGLFFPARYFFPVHFFLSSM